MKRVFYRAARASGWRAAFALGLLALAAGCGRVDEDTCSYVDRGDSRREVEESLGSPTETDVGALSTVRYYGRMADEPGEGGCCRVVYDGAIASLFVEEATLSGGEYYPDGCTR